MSNLIEFAASFARFILVSTEIASTDLAFHSGYRMSPMASACVSQNNSIPVIYSYAFHASFMRFPSCASDSNGQWRQAAV